jgi:DNA polymerase epsilon subunit 1
MKFAIVTEGGLKCEEIINYDTIKQQILERLKALFHSPKRKERPVIYHVDVAAMYPNIILTNRLQPPSIVNDIICSSCIFNQPENLWSFLFYLLSLTLTLICSHSLILIHMFVIFGFHSKKKMSWEWRVDYMPLNRNEFEMIKNQLEFESNLINFFIHSLIQSH